MTKPKAIFFDLDGTLLSSGIMPKTAGESLVYAKNKGILLFIATGRHKNEIKNVLGDSSLFDGYVSVNGGYCYAGSEVIYKNPIAKSDISFAVEYTKNSPLTCMFCETNEMYINISDKYAEQINKALSLTLPPIKNIERALDEDIYQLVIFSNELKDVFEKNLKHSSLTSWTTDCYDVVPTTTNKWVGIQHMLKHFNLHPSEVAAIGDGTNDIEMLTGAGHPIAMGNAIDELKKIAKYVTRHVDDGGIKHAVEWLLLSK
ncbi:MAG: HAD family hydrolase [Defluviitaleaceae bacterium]|nr:HAD family hydrolase [Defluviitaleaceae bacterium]